MVTGYLTNEVVAPPWHELLLTAAWCVRIRYDENNREISLCVGAPLDAAGGLCGVPNVQRIRPLFLTTIFSELVLGIDKNRASVPLLLCVHTLSGGVFPAVLLGREPSEVEGGSIPYGKTLSDPSGFRRKSARQHYFFYIVDIESHVVLI